MRHPIVKSAVAVILLICIIWLVNGCTWATQDQSTREGEGTPGGVPTEGSSHISVMPAVLVCFLSSCDAQFNDRTERAAGSDGDNMNQGDIEAEQTATDTPTVDVSPVP
jgi:hypothetical protein